MKTKPILITLLIIAALICGFLLIRSKYFAKPGKGEIAQFLNAFNEQVKAGNADSVRRFFNEDKNGRQIALFIKVITGKTGLNGKTKPLFKVSLNTEDSKITFVDPEIATAIVTANFSSDKLAGKVSAITFTIHKNDRKEYKIYSVSSLTFTADYTAYQSKLIVKTLPETDIFDPMTLAAFKTADKLKARYDSVLWFQHINNKTFYYVIKGKISEYYYWPERDQVGKERSDLKMGLVSPDLKEIIPVEYDLVHNIGGTIDKLIEVEKGDKKGFYDITGKMVVPVIYDEAFPLKNDESLALLKKGDDYFYLKEDLTITDVLPGFKITDALPKIRMFGESKILSDGNSKSIMEYNSKDNFTSLIISPSYMVSWQLLPKFINFQDPLRKPTEEMAGDGDGSVTLDVEYAGNEKDENNWFESAYYSVMDNYLGGRSGLYTSKKVLLIDKKQNRIMGFTADSYFVGEEDGAVLSGTCNENSLKALSDSLFEFKTTSSLDRAGIIEGPYYHYLQIKNGKLIGLPGKRIFAFTQYVKMDDSYLQGCFLMAGGGSDIYHPAKSKPISHLTNEVLQYMKNEIYASYQYKFKNPKWTDAFIDQFERFNGANLTNVDDSLTAIDKYNISFINAKLNGAKTPVLAAK